jgi:hypothetical protein
MASRVEPSRPLLPGLQDRDSRLRPASRPVEIDRLGAKTVASLKGLDIVNSPHGAFATLTLDAVLSIFSWKPIIVDATRMLRKMMEYGMAACIGRIGVPALIKWNKDANIPDRQYGGYKILNPNIWRLFCPT